MTPVLSYEQPLHIEGHRTFADALLSLAAGLTAVATPFGAAVAVCVWRRSELTAALWLASGPAAGIALIVVAATFEHRTAVFTDRLEVSFVLAGLCLWQRRVPWLNLICWQQEPLGPGLFRWRVVRLRLLVRSGRDVLVGSADPMRLAKAIQSARSLPRSAQPVGYSA